ncbi:MAG: hypothetical protein Q9165_006833 [Trypethelium subeluteriae]
MKFLQKPRDSSEEQPKPATTARTARKKRQEKVYDEQVSTFFGAKKPCLSERDPNVMSMTKRDKQKKDSHESAHRLSPPQGARKHSVALERTQGASISAKSVLPGIELPGRPFPGFDKRGMGPRDTSHYTWSDSNRHPTSLCSVMPLGPPQDISPIPHDPLEDEVGHLGALRPFARGKRLSPRPLDSNFTSQNAGTCKPEVRADRRTPSHGSPHSHAEIADAACLNFDNTEHNAKSPLAIGTDHNHLKDASNKESSSSLSHLLHECEAAVANPLPVQPLKLLRHDRAQKVGELESQIDFQRNIEEHRSRTESKREPPELACRESPAQDGHGIYIEPNGEEFPHQRALLDSEVVYGTASLRDEFEDSLEMLWDKDEAEAQVDWQRDGSLHKRNRDYNNPVTSGEQGIDSAETRQWEQYLGRFWRPNRLY